MLKEVGASGQISLGKKYAGRLFDVVFYPDGRVEMVPMKAVPTVGQSLDFQHPAAAAATLHAGQENTATYRVGDGWLTPERLAARTAACERTPEQLNAARDKFEEDNKDAIEAMNQRIAKVGSMGRRIPERRKTQRRGEAAFD